MAESVRICNDNKSFVTSLDFWSPYSSLHPIIIGSATLLVVFLYLRLVSNRTLAPTTIFSWVGSVALGSTISRIITGPDLSFVQGLFSLGVIVFFEYTATFFASHLPRLAFIVISPPVLLAFRGEVDWRKCRHHRISPNGLMLILRQRGLYQVSQVEAVVLEPTGQFSIIARLRPDQQPDDILLSVPGYAERLKNWKPPEEAKQPA